MPADKIKLDLQKIVQSPNVAQMLSEKQLKELGTEIVDLYNKDKGTRSEWEIRSEDAINLALQLREQKSFPWENCSNVKFPLLTIAALQFLARISIMTKGKRLVKVSHIGPDKLGKKSAQGRRISQHMSLQLTAYDPNWIEQDEQAKFEACLLGASFKKTYYDSIEGQVISQHVPASHFVVDYFCKDVDNANRATHLMSMNLNKLKERENRGIFLPFEETSDAYVPTTQRESENARQGITRPQITSEDETTEVDIIEQHGWKDLDGDGYAEPYVFTVCLTTKQVLRIVARFTDTGDVHRVFDKVVKELEASTFGLEDMKLKSQVEKKIDSMMKDKANKIVRIDPMGHFTRYLFIPSPDGGVYGLGLGTLLGSVNDSVSTMVNQLIDSGTMSVTAGGFLGRGVKMKAGQTAFNPFEWKPVESTGNDLRANIFPLPVREPSAVLFQLLSLLIGYAERISGATDLMSGVAPGQNTPAETSRNTIEQGMMLFSGIYARMYRSFTSELSKFLVFNRTQLSASTSWVDWTTGDEAILAPDDYTGNRFRLLPSVSAEAVSQQQIRDKAMMLVQLSEKNPGFNKYIVMRDFLEAHDIDNIDDVYPDPAGPKALPPPVNPALELKKAELAHKDKVHEDEMQVEVIRLQESLELNGAKIKELEARAQKELAEVAKVGPDIEHTKVLTQLEAARAQQQGMQGALDMIHKFTQLHMQQKQQGVDNEHRGKELEAKKQPPEAKPAAPAAQP
jgi:chaperonin GroES